MAAQHYLRKQREMRMRSDRSRANALRQDIRYLPEIDGPGGHGCPRTRMSVFIDLWYFPEWISGLCCKDYAFKNYIKWIQYGDWLDEFIEPIQFLCKQTLINNQSIAVLIFSSQDNRVIIYFVTWRVVNSRLTIKFGGRSDNSVVFTTVGYRVNW